MKILITSASYVFSDYLPGGENRVSYEIVKELDRRGHRILLFSPKIDLKTFLKNTELIEVGGYRFSQDDYLSYRLNWWRYNLKSYKVAKKLLRKEKIDIIHHIRPAYSGRFSLAGTLGKPFIYGPITPTWSKIPLDEALSKVERKKRPILGAITRAFTLFEKFTISHLWKKTLKDSSAILIQMEKLKESIPHEFLSKVKVVGLGVDTDFFRPPDEPFDGNAILFLANLYRRKGLEDLLKAMPIVLSRIPDTRLIVVGDGPDRDFFVELTKNLGLEEKVDFEGSVPHYETVKYYKSANIYCLPSYGEPAANTILEAMSCGLPIVATKSGGVPDIVVNGKSGILVLHRDSDALSEALITLLKDEGKRKEMGLFNRRMVEDRFSIKGLVDKIEDTYRLFI